MTSFVVGLHCCAAYRSVHSQNIFMAPTGSSGSFFLPSLRLPWSYIAVLYIGINVFIIWQKLLEEYIQHLKIFQKLKWRSLKYSKIALFLVQKRENYSLSWSNLVALKRTTSDWANFILASLCSVLFWSSSFVSIHFLSNKQALGRTALYVNLASPFIYSERFSFFLGQLERSSVINFPF